MQDGWEKLSEYALERRSKDGLMRKSKIYTENLADIRWTIKDSQQMMTAMVLFSF